MRINKLLKEVVDLNASDLHLTQGLPPVLRVDGILVQKDTSKLKREDMEAILAQLLSKEKALRFETDGEVDFSYIIPELGPFRVNAYRQRGTIGVAVRVLSTRVPDLQELGLPEVVAKMARRKRGLILITGPTGSGKSTTMAAMIELINSSKNLHIITLEDPIEYLHRHKKSIVTQREIGRDSRTFIGGLRAALRQDPDVIMVGEMRDLETISTVITAAETGHLVLATLHTNDAAQSVERIIDSFPSNQQQQVRIQLANSLVGVITQNLLPHSNGKGRVVAAEVLICNYAVRNLIRDNKIHQIPSVVQTNTNLGMQTIDKHLQQLFEKGMVTKEEVLDHSRDEKAMLDYFKKHNKAESVI